MDAPAVIIGLGAATPVGRTVWGSAAAVRAGVVGFSEHPFMLDTAGEPMRVARAPWVDVSVPYTDRCIALLFSAIDEALQALKNRPTLLRGPVGLALALPSERPGRPAELARALAAGVEEQYGRLFSRTVAFEHGHAAGHSALDAALRSLAAASIDTCVVAGVDSYLPPETLEWLESLDQLHGAGPLNNAWGFIPGEAAAALLVTTPRTAESAGVEALGVVVGVGLARETKLIKSDDVCIGEGLTNAFRRALATLPPHEQVHNVVCDLNGETYRADEYGFTALRVKDRFREATDFTAPADCWGDVGAASAPLHIALAAVTCRKGYSKGPVSMAWASSESGERGATLLWATAGARH